MELALTDEQQMLADSVARFVEGEYDFEARMRLIEAGEGGSASVWRVFAENGWLMVGVPEELGGLGGSPVETAIIAQQLGRGLVIEPFIGSAVLAVQVLVAAARKEELGDWLPSLCGGSRRLALAYSEAGAHGQPHIVAARAERGDDGYRLHGRKTLVLGAVGANAFIVSARTAGRVDERDGISLFLVPAEEALVAPVLLHDGSVAADMVLDGSSGRLLGGAGAGLPALEHGLAHATLALCAELVGAMEKSIELTAEYLRTRSQFGSPLSGFQALQHRMADMAAEMELARSMLFAALASFENDDADKRRLALSAAKALIGGAARNVCGQGIQLHGGIGMTEEYAIGHYFKRAVVADALFGGRTVHEALCAEALAEGLLGTRSNSAANQPATLVGAL